MTAIPRYSSTFIFEVGALDDDLHRLAKSRHEEWLGAYRVVISEVQSVYGDPALGLEHTPDDAIGEQERGSGS